MLAKGHAHRAELRRCVSTVDKRYHDFTVRMGQYRHLLEMALGGCSQVGVSEQRSGFVFVDLPLTNALYGGPARTIRT